MRKGFLQVGGLILGEIIRIGLKWVSGLGFRVFGLKGLAFRAARVARDRPPPTNSDNKGSWT